MFKSSHEDFKKQFSDDCRLTTIEITYRLPDYHSILQEFLWQTLDRPPDYPRMYKFLDYWIKNIEAPIYSVKIASVDIILPGEYKLIDQIYKI